MNSNVTHPAVGITGGIGVGKSTVCRIFEALGIPVYDADYWAKWLIINDLLLKKQIEDIFGPEAYLSDGTYNRAFVASQVFSDKNKLAALNACVHPAVAQHGAEWHLAQIERGCLYTLKEAALMIESGSYRQLDCLIVVTAPELLRIQRVMQRDGVDEKTVRARISSQMPEEEKLKFADFIIHNDEKHALIPQVWEIHQKIVQKIFGKTAAK
jgi:dephospho-CoA kinase